MGHPGVTHSPLHSDTLPDWTFVHFAAEEVAGEYVWGVYDLLLLPPSFPYGGMENPCLTFVTPTLLAGDRSLVNVVAHEIAHSWTGNLVTNATWEHFWLNEGDLLCLSLLDHTTRPDAVLSSVDNRYVSPATRLTQQPI